MPGGFEAIGGLLLAVVPGYLALWVWAWKRTWRGHSGDLRTLLQSLSLSMVVQLLLAPLTIRWLLPFRDDPTEVPERVALWMALAVLILPAGLGLLGRRLIGSSGPSEWPSIWDWMLTKQPPHGCFVVVEFEDGQRLAGCFTERANAITSPDTHGVYLSPEWRLDEAGDVAEELPGSRGVLIPDLCRVRWMRILEPASEDD